jgi:hypothetical protein
VLKLGFNYESYRLHQNFDYLQIFVRADLLALYSLPDVRINGQLPEWKDPPRLDPQGRSTHMTAYVKLSNNPNISF